MYAIVVSESTSSLWPTAVSQLRQKYEEKWPGQVHVLTYPSSSEGSSDDSHPVRVCLPRLSELRPCYCCFVAHYTECDKRFVREVNQLTRQLDPATPYTDVVWGILTGLAEEDVQFAIQQEPLVIRRVVGNCPIDLEKFHSGVWFSEFRQGVSFSKRPSSSTPSDSTVDCATPTVAPPTVMEEACPPDATHVIASEVSCPRQLDNDQGVDMIISSAHATERDWNIGYAFPSGKFLSEGGQLYGLSLAGERMDVQRNGSAKVLSAAGNCLMGYISGKDCMALAWMHSANVVQMVGYIEPTWFGYGGWGVHNYLINNPGSMTFATSFFANQQCLLHLLHSKYSRHFDTPLGEHRDVYGRCFNTTQTAMEGLSRECSGLLYDRDNVAFYGDPAWEASLARAEDEELYHYT